MNAILTIQKNGQILKSQPLVSGEMVLGRGEGCVIRLEDRAVSRQHAVLRSSPSGFSIEKKTPVAPLKVNGSECDAALLKEGDEIHIGPFLLRISISENIASAPVTQADPASQTAPPPEAALPALQGFSEQSPVEMSLDAEAVIAMTPEVAPQTSEPSLSLGSIREVEQPPAEIDVSSVTSAQIPVEEDARTMMIGSSSVKLRVRLPPGTANVESKEFDVEEISIGRGKGCDIVLNDKRASRKHAVIRRSGQGAGTTYVLLDLQSANGTYVNGARVTEHTLAGDDLVRIGEAEMVVQAVSPGYESRAEKFLKVEEPAAIHVDPTEDAGLFGAQMPAESQLPSLSQGESVELAGNSGRAQSASTGFSNVSGIAGISVGGAGKGSLLDSFKALPPGQRITRIAIAGLIALLITNFFSEEGGAPGESQKKVPSSQASSLPVASGTQRGAPGAPTMPSFAELKPELQKFVDSQYNLAMEYYRNRDFDSALHEVEKIFQYVSEYKDATDLKRYSVEGKQRLQAQEEERKRKESERQIKEKVTQLIFEIEGHMNRKEYDRAREYFAQVIILDPENAQVVEWKKEIQKHDEELRIAEDMKRIALQTNENALEIVNNADLLKKDGAFLKAIETYESALQLQPSDKKLVARAKAGIEKSRQQLKEALDPLIAQGLEAEGQNDFTKAFQSYEKARSIDPQARDAIEGIKRIRGILGEQMKNLYTAGVLAESYSDFVSAKAKFEQIVQTAPKDDPYFERAKRKLLKYVVKDEVKVE